MSGTRPIPISNRGRASPPTSSSSRGGSPSLNDLHGISQSCPVHAHNNSNTNGGGGYARFQPPRAPRFGSLPEPSFLQIDENPMPELLLPPPVQSHNNSPAAPSVAQVRVAVFVCLFIPDHPSYYFIFGDGVTNFNIWCVL